MRMRNLNENYFRVSDFPLAVALAISFPIEAVDRRDPRRACFLFEHSDRLDCLVTAYHRRELRVEPQEYHLRSKELKARLYDQS